MPATAGCMVVRIVDRERDAGVVGEGPLDLVGVPLVQTEHCVVGVVAAALVILILHEVQVPAGGQV